MIKKCIVCGKKVLGKPILQYDNMPASAQSLPKYEELNEDIGITLELYQCTECGLVQLNNDPVNYYKDVIRAVGISSTMRMLRERQYEHLINKYNLRGKKIVEIGCGRGEYLEILSQFIDGVFGIENNDEYVKIARAKGLNVYKKFLDSEDSTIESGPFDAFLSFNFLEHQPNPNTMLKAIYNNLTENGVGIITVPDLDYIVNKAGCYEFIRDHLAYYSLDSLDYLLHKNGFIVEEHEIINGDTISVIVRKRKKADLSVLENNYDIIKSDFDSFILREEKKGKTISIWGASHQAFTVVSMFNLQERIRYFIDSAEFKQGKYSPASHIPIISPKEALEKPTDIVIIAAPGYAKEIANIIRQKYPNKTDVVVLVGRGLEIWEG